MGEEMARRSPSSEEWSSLEQDVKALAWEWAKRSTGAATELTPGQMETSGASPKEIRAAFLARLAALKQVASACEELASTDVADASRWGASGEEIGSAWGVSWQAVNQRWGHITRGGDRVAVVISRRNRVHRDDAAGEYGEVGGERQYKSDRGSWPVGAEVREKAEYAIIAVDGTVQRVYHLVPGEWLPVGAKWCFTGMLLTEAEAEAAHAAGELPLRPGDACPTQRGRAYRPHWF